jgi:primosomal protein N' (replication factor Y)
MPTTTHIVDLREEFKDGNKSIFSRLLMKKIKDALAQKKQIILFLNKRGFSSSLTCRQCGFTMKCPNCDVALTYHKESDRKMYMLCHYCGVRQKIPQKCPECQSLYIRFFGIGTQKIEEIIKDLFPKAHVARADRDTTSNKSSFEKIYTDFKNGTTDILVGTQIIAKGLDIENVGLIGVMLADIGFHIPDFRASERVFQLLTQVSGRTGRLGTSGEVVIQTYLPDHPAIRFASEANYKDFFASEIAERKAYHYPPFSKMIKLIFVHKDQQKCFQEAENMYKEIQWILDHKREIQGKHIAAYLTPPLIAKLHNKYHYHIILKGDDPRSVLSFLTLKKGWKVDVDPIAIG